ncbi:Mitochondrial phosphate carrier protein 3, mitochondrial [Trebouxia sp. C0009 RCD-2024]
MQIDSKRYSSIKTGFKITFAEGGIAGLCRGWLPTFLGYSIQGAGKYGLYEYFKHSYADLAGAETAARYQTPLFLAASASAEFIADVGLCPLEAVKVKVQTTPGYAKGLTDGLPKFVQQNGVAGLWKGLVPLWGRQIPYTMMKFAAFENIVQALYVNVVPKPKSECSKTEQLGVSFVAGYLAGILCAAISHPADNLVSKLNATKEATIGSVVREMGWRQLATRGLGLRIVMIGTLTATQWAIYDSFKVYVGLPTTGAAPPAENPEEKAIKA